MYFSAREKKILELLLEYHQGIDQEELEGLLNVSRRTVYREISSLEKTLHPLDIQLLKERGKGYFLLGDEEALTRLREELLNKRTDDFGSTLERQHAITAKLLVEANRETIQSLAFEFRVSPATMMTDLKNVEQSLNNYRLSLDRVQGDGLAIIGDESERRNLLRSLIYNGVNEYDFFHHLRRIDETNLQHKAGNYFLKLVSNEALYVANQVISESQLFQDVTDNQLVQILLILAISIDRMNLHHPIEEEYPIEDIEFYQHAQKILQAVGKMIGQSIVNYEASFLARQLSGVNYKIPQNIFLESYDVTLSYQVRELIAAVSQETINDFRKDDMLFYDLSAHMAAALKRNYASFDKEANPLLKKVIEEYPALYQAITKQLYRIFTSTHFNEEELGYILIHFASSLERSPQQRGASVLVLCSSGIGTSKILESRLTKYVPEIESTQVARISQMDYINFAQFDLILSTIFLPGFEFPYKMISPLLLEDELAEIRSVLMKQTHRAVPNHLNEATQVENSAMTFERIYERMRVANNLLKQFDMYSLVTEESLFATIEKMIERLQGVIVQDAGEVAQKVFARYQIAPIGIPNTNFALFHCSSDKVNLPYFGIFELSKAVPIAAMDGSKIELSRMLLLLAPEPLDHELEVLLGKISSSVIDSDLNIEIYKKGDKELIYHLLSSLFVDEIREVN
ncbi:BglG family transcription antiterminator [Enterococcus camelliae]|uniref:BglG family transcription antiterminator n=1 Tax=Enterococcus camelliae TaxID=453959 RepID=A0ABW5TGP2_9ENTE